MALIGKIRENSWFLIAAIVLGMGGFLFMDMIGGSRGSSLMGTQNLVGKIEGEKIQIDKFQNRERAFYGGAQGDTYAQREQFWNFLVEETLLNKEGEAIGMQVAPEELRALFDGEDAFISPTVRQEFGNPQTGQFDVSLVRQYLDADPTTIDPGIGAYIKELQKRVAREQMAKKLNTLTSKSMYTPTWMAESVFAENNVGASISLVTVPYTAIADSDVTVSDEDIRNYMNAHPNEFINKEPTRSVTWVEFGVSPTAEDTLGIQETVSRLAAQFQTTDSDSAFTTENFGFYNTEYIGADEMSAIIADSVMTMPIGSVMGPYLDNGKSNGDPNYDSYGFYKAVKLIDRKAVPDSVDTRHILIQVQNVATNLPAVEAAIAQLDSVKMFIEERDSSFADMARKYGQDGTAALGGDVGMMGSKNLLPEYRDAVFYESKVGDLKIVTTGAGVHLIEVLGKVNTGKVGARVAYVEEIIVPSSETQNNISNQAFEFVSTNRDLESLNQSALEAGLNTRTEAGIKPNDFQIGQQTFDPLTGRPIVNGLASGESARNIVRWAHESDTKVGAVSPEVFDFDDPVEFYTNKYVVVALSDKSSEGKPGIDAIRDQVTPLVLQEKKAALIAERIKGKSLEAIAGEYSVSVDSIENIRFNGGGGSRNVNIGNEPAVIGSAFKLNVGETSEPVQGEAGVYVIQMNTKPGVPEATDLAGIRRQYNLQMTRGLNNAVGSNPLINAIREKSDVTDRRSKFF